MTLSLSEYVAVLRNDLMSFTERAFHELNPQTRFFSAPYIELIASKLEACRQGRIKRLAINLPPRHLKSHCASIVLPAWYLAHNPAGHVICASYGQDLSEKMARDCRRIIASAWYRAIFPTRLSHRQAVHDFATTEQGTRLATSVGGVLTGRGADLIIIDDSLKPDDALSEIKRKSVNEWYDNTLVSRLNSKAEGCIVIVMQRLHQDDLVGRVLEQEQWEVLSFPAIAESNEEFLIESPLGTSVYRRRIGEVLDARRESPDTLAGIRATIGEYNFASQYQQSPIPVGGAMVKTAWLLYYTPADRPERFEQVVQSWDTANKANELSDYSVCTTWGVARGHFYLLDVFRDRLEYPDLKRKVRALREQYLAQTILIEDHASGTQLIQDLRTEGMPWIKESKPPPGTDKIMRLHTQTGAFEGGFVHLPKTASWLAEYVTELTGFPGSKFDDQVDSTTQALAYLTTQQPQLELWRSYEDALRRGEGLIPRRHYDRSKRW